ncbi:MAG: hypothetical protein ACU84J_09255 [Gammaproteobacteria bacterium]
MFSKKILKLFGMISIVLVSGVLLIAQEEKSDFLKLLGSESYANCGLEKLSHSERNALMSQLIIGPAVSYISASAETYMEKEAWRKVRVLGIVEADDLFDDHWLLVWDNYELFTLDPFGKVELPEPGLYWAKNTLSSWTILNSDADKLSFTAREIDN